MKFYSPFISWSSFRDKLADWQTGVFSLIIHLLLALLLGGTVLYRATKEPEDFVSEGGFLVDSPESGAPSGPPDLAPAPVPVMNVVVPTPQSSLSAIISTNPVAEAFQVPLNTSVLSMSSQMTANAVKSAQQAVNGISGGGGGGGDAGKWGKSSGKGSWGQGFGKMEKDDLKFAGNMYDIKQDRKGKEKEAGDFYGILEKFIQSRFNTELLKDYFKSDPIYTAQFYIPKIDATEGPKAFNLEKKVKPSGWFIYYQGGFSPPKSGRYRFWSRADDTLIAVVDGKAVLDVSRDSANPSKWDGKTNKFEVKEPFPGDWMTLNERETYRLDLIIGERPGGSFECYLMIEEEGVKYEKDENGRLILPIFSTLPLDEVPIVSGALKVQKLPLIMTPKRNVFGPKSSLNAL